MNSKNKLANNRTKYFIVFITTLLISGCQITGIHQVETDEITQKNKYKIVNVIMKNGDTLDLRNSTPQFFRYYKNKKNVIVYTALDTLRTPEDSVTVLYNKDLIELNNIHAVTIEKSSFHLGETVLLVLSVMLVMFVAFMIFVTNVDWSH